MKKLTILILTICLAHGLLLHAEVYTIATIPDTKLQGQDYYVTNPDGILADSTETKLNQLLTQLERETEVEVAVVVVDSIALVDENCYDSHSFALQLFNTWGIGDKDKNTGVLVFLSRERRDIEIITGSGIEGVLTDLNCSRILDDNFDYFHHDDFDQGMAHVCADLADFLSQDENRDELLFSWNPKDDSYSVAIAWWRMVGFALMMVFAWLGYKRLNGEPGQLDTDIQSQSEDWQTGSGCLVWIFPIPFLFFYLYAIFARKHVKTVPLVCDRCHKPMKLISKEKREPNMLTKQEQAEERMGAYNYYVWQCPDCHKVEKDKRKGPSFGIRSVCPECGARAMETSGSNTLQAPTHTTSGLREYSYVCRCCGHTKKEQVVLDALSYGSSSSGSSSRSGGYRSHSSHRSGSHGGGRSSGGGAGRHF
ncbi:MAG: TPM domain-containing protein [Paludibacteraceae bacterium]|nr:TPM domain-containing protein [Paludibacteraceae bacterium]